jgi:hypothetical protein
MSSARGLHTWSPPTRGLLHFDLPPQRQRALPIARGLILQPLRWPGLDLAPAGDEGHVNIRGSAAPDK